MWSLIQRYREVLLAGVLLIWPLISFLSKGHRGREPNVFDRGLLAVVAPVQNVLTWTVTSVGDGLEGYVSLRGAHVEAAECRMNLAASQVELNMLKEARAENERLKAMLGYVEKTVGQELVARVVGINPSPQFLSLRINHGESDGVHVGMPVITSSGVAGQIIRAVGGSADVMLLTDPSSRIGAVVQRTRVRATVTGMGDGRRLSVDFVRKEDDVVDGDTLVTAGTDGVFPAGLVLGVVEGVSRPPVGMYLTAQLRAAVDLNRVEEVLVVPQTLADSSVPHEGAR